MRAHLRSFVVAGLGLVGAAGVAARAVAGPAPLPDAASAQRGPVAPSDVGRTRPGPPVPEGPPLVGGVPPGAAAPGPATANGNSFPTLPPGAPGAVPPGSVVAPGPAAASTGVHGAVVSRGRYAMLRVAPGALDMGSGPDEPDRRDDETRHAVRITRPFVVGATEVTTRLWREVEGRLPPDATDPGPEAAVTHVAWMEAVHFCNDLSRLEGYAPAYAIAEPAPGDVSARVDWVPDADGYRLLTEAEWEYAARAGGATPWAGSATPDAVAWTRTAGLAAPPMVARRRPNAWGLYDTSGGVWEWVWDRAGAYPPGPLTDPTGPDYGFFRVLRGGSWRLPATEARVAARGWAPPFVSDETTGLRIARTLTGPEP